ncbi:diguanylate cyclase [Acetobacteraceae bacterium KSS8]|uniref:diguanylate cyclase n=2 Tax=Endosaccharibacter trunci TaxID=2812733 RepID=A0ABT1W6I4_9PROT|nr:diguanylate cyclase [Acetobacteraceae bacterium KSS8]
MTRLFCADASGYSSFWPANAAMLVALLRLRPRFSIPVLLACFGINVGLNQISGLSPDEALLACAMNLLQVLLTAPPVRRFCGARTDLTRLRRQGRFGLIVFAATAIEAAIGVFVERCFLGDPDNVIGDWAQWVMCDALGLMLATPAVLLMMNWLPERRIKRGATMEPMALMTGILLLTVVSFLSPRSFLFFFLYPALVTLAFRTPPIWALSTVLFVSILVSMFTAHNLGPIALMSPDGPLMSQKLLQPFLWTLFLSALPANMMVGEKMRSARRLSLLRAHLEHAATHDPLTGLMTRQPFRLELASRLRSGVGGTLLFIDLDYFKQVNDRLGHQAGDSTLCLFSQRMERCARERGGRAARFGGDEFAMLLPRMPNEAALHHVLCTILETARSPYQLEERTAHLSVSIGVATLDRCDSVDEVIRRADRALYAAKDAGRNGFRLYEDTPPTDPPDPAAEQTRQMAV